MGEWLKEYCKEFKNENLERYTMEKNINHEGSPKAARFEVIAYAILIAIFVYYIYLAANMFMMDHDSFLYLNNAKLILGDHSIGYAATSPPLISIIAAPFLIIFKSDMLKAFTSLKYVMLVIAVLFVIISNHFFKKRFSREDALLGTLMLSLNLVFLHSITDIMPDILSGLLVATALITYVKARNDKGLKTAFLTAFLIFLSFLAKFPNGAIIFVIFLFEAFDKNWKFMKSKKFWIIIVLPFIAYYLLFSVAYTVFYGFNENSIFGVFKSVSAHMLLNSDKDMAQALYNVELIDPPYEFLVELLLSSSAAIMILAAMGIGVLLKRWEPYDKMVLAWMLGFFVPYLFMHKESRYMIVFLPAFYCIALNGIILVKKCATSYKNITTKTKNAFWVAFLFIILATPVYNAYALLSEYPRDPTYFEPFPYTLTEFLKEESVNGTQTYFVGSGYYIVPKHFRFTDYDETMFISLIGETQLMFFGHTAYAYKPDYAPTYNDSEMTVSLMDPMHGTTQHLEILTRIVEDNPLGNDDLILFSGTDRNYYTNTLPDNYNQTLYVYRIFVDDLRISQVSGIDNRCSTFINEKKKISLCLSGTGYDTATIEFFGFENGTYSIYFQPGLRYVAEFEIEDGKNKYSIRGLRQLYTGQNAEYVNMADAITIAHLEKLKSFSIYSDKV